MEARRKGRATGEGMRDVERSSKKWEELGRKRRKMEKEVEEKDRMEVERRKKGEG